MNLKAIILFDGVCKFCDDYVNYLIRKDKKDIFRFASLQSDTAKRIIHDHNIHTANLETVIVIYDGKVYYKSSAVLKLFSLLGGIHSLMTIFYIFPTFICNFFYDLFAKYRYRVFGKYDQCIIPDEKIKRKFLE